MLRQLVNNFMQLMAKETIKRTAAEEGLASAEAATEAKKMKQAKRTKYAMLLSYQGHNYFGMQIQNDTINFPTIEGHVLDAMLKHSFITAEQRADPYSFHFQRCARTDRHVSAVRQIVSMELRRNDDFLRDGTALMNASLPSDIRVCGIKRTTPSFHAQKGCDGRTYSYTTPTYAFAACDEVTSDAYRISAERIAQINELLSVYNGTHNYYNYTARLEHADQRCKRRVISFKCDKPFVYMCPVRNREVEFLTLYVHGQSFIMHQIRKMMGAVICVLRGFMYKSDLARSFLCQRLDIPRAPGLGLLLERMHFDQYEKRFGHTHGSLNHWGDEIEAAVLEARDQLIVQRILREECATQSMMQWLSTLPLHQYIVDPEDAVGTNTSDLFVAAQNGAAGIPNSAIDDADDEARDTNGGGDDDIDCDQDGDDDDDGGSRRDRGGAVLIGQEDQQQVVAREEEETVRSPGGDDGGSSRPDETKVALDEEETEQKQQQQRVAAGAAN